MRQQDLFEQFLEENEIIDKVQPILNTQQNSTLPKMKSVSGDFFLIEYSKILSLGSLEEVFKYLKESIAPSDKNLKIYLNGLPSLFNDGTYHLDINLPLSEQYPNKDSFHSSTLDFIINVVKNYNPAFANNSNINIKNLNNQTTLTPEIKKIIFQEYKTSKPHIQDIIRYYHPNISREFYQYDKVKANITSTLNINKDQYSFISIFLPQECRESLLYLYDQTIDDYITTNTNYQLNGNKDYNHIILTNPAFFLHKTFLPNSNFLYTYIDQYTSIKEHPLQHFNPDEDARDELFHIIRESLKTGYELYKKASKDKKFQQIHKNNNEELVYANNIYTNNNSTYEKGPKNALKIALIDFENQKHPDLKKEDTRFFFSETHRNLNTLFLNLINHNLVTEAEELYQEHKDILSIKTNHHTSKIAPLNYDEKNIQLYQKYNQDISITHQKSYIYYNVLKKQNALTDFNIKQFLYNSLNYILLFSSHYDNQDINKEIIDAHISVVLDIKQHYIDQNIYHEFLFYIYNAKYHKNYLDFDGTLENYILNIEDNALNIHSTSTKDTILNTLLTLQKCLTIDEIESLISPYEHTHVNGFNMILKTNSHNPYISNGSAFFTALNNFYKKNKKNLFIDGIKNIIPFIYSNRSVFSKKFANFYIKKPELFKQAINNLSQIKTYKIYQTTENNHQDLDNINVDNPVSLLSNNTVLKVSKIKEETLSFVNWWAICMWSPIEINAHFKENINNNMKNHNGQNIFEYVIEQHNKSQKELIYKSRHNDKSDKNDLQSYDIHHLNLKSNAVATSIRFDDQDFDGSGLYQFVLSIYNQYHSNVPKNTNEFINIYENYLECNPHQQNPLYKTYIPYNHIHVFNSSKILKNLIENDFTILSSYSIKNVIGPILLSDSNPALLPSIFKNLDEDQAADFLIKIITIVRQSSHHFSIDKTHNLFSALINAYPYDFKNKTINAHGLITLMLRKIEDSDINLTLLGDKEKDFKKINANLSNLDKLSLIQKQLKNEFHNHETLYPNTYINKSLNTVSGIISPILDSIEKKIISEDLIEIDIQYVKTKNLDLNTPAIFLKYPLRLDQYLKMIFYTGQYTENTDNKNSIDNLQLLSELIDANMENKFLLQSTTKYQNNTANKLKRM